MAYRVVIEVDFFKGVCAMLLKEVNPWQTCWNQNKV